MISVILSILLNRFPKTIFTEEEIAQYEKLALTIVDGGLINYELPFEKHRFLLYLSAKGNYLFHGSNQLNIERFEPRDQTLFNGELTKAVFASSDPIWSTFYAVLDRSKVVGGFRNGCVIGGKRKYHYYSINDATMNEGPWTSGMIYILPKDKFKLSGHGKIQFDEWISHEHVMPICKMSISVDDFYYKNKVSVHKDNESLLKTWLLYKIRVLKMTRKRAS